VTFGGTKIRRHSPTGKVRPYFGIQYAWNCISPYIRVAAQIVSISKVALYVTKVINGEGRGIAQAVSRWLRTATAQVRARPSATFSTTNPTPLDLVSNPGRPHIYRTSQLLGSRILYNPYTHYNPCSNYWTAPNPLRMRLSAARPENTDSSSGSVTRKMCNMSMSGGESRTRDKELEGQLQWLEDVASYFSYDFPELARQSCLFPLCNSTHFGLSFSFQLLNLYLSLWPHRLLGGNALHLHSGGSQLKPRPGHRRSRLRCDVAFLCPSRQMPQLYLQASLYCGL
jgi:hypothetical protein